MKKKIKKATSLKLQAAWQPVPDMIGWSLISFDGFPIDKFVKPYTGPWRILQGPAQLKGNMKAEIYNYEGRLVANNEETILELLELNGYIIDPDEKDMKKLRIKHGVDDE